MLYIQSLRFVKIGLVYRVENIIYFITKIDILLKSIEIARNNAGKKILVLKVICHGNELKMLFILKQACLLIMATQGGYLE